MTRIHAHSNSRSNHVMMLVVFVVTVFLLSGQAVNVIQIKGHLLKQKPQLQILSRDYILVHFRVSGYSLNL